MSPALVPRAPLLGLLLATAACIAPPEPGADAGPDADTDAPGETGGSTDPSGQTDDASSDTASSDTASSDTADTDDPVDAACVDTHPGTDPTVVVDWSQWPELPEGTHGYQVAVEFDAPCTVTAVDPEADPVVTELECDDAGTMRGLSFTIPAAEDPVAWAVGEAVQVAYHHLAWDYEHYGLQRDDLSMRRADDGGLLLASMNQDWLYPDTFAPVVLTVDEERCQPDSVSDDDTWNLVVDFDNGAGATTQVGHMQQGTLAPAVGEGTLAIDVGEARYGAYYCCHASRELEVLIRRTL